MPSLSQRPPHVAAAAVKSDFRPSNWVNPFIGASTSVGEAGVYHGLGKTFPGATTPFGMVQLSPNTITGGDNGPGRVYIKSARLNGRSYLLRHIDHKTVAAGGILELTMSDTPD